MIAEMFAPSATRAVVVDWIEMMACVAISRSYTFAEFTSGLRIRQSDVNGTAADESTGEDIEVEISDEKFEEFAGEVLAEIEWRVAVLGKLYPFELVAGPYGWKLSRIWAHDRPVRRAQHFYIACLLMANIRYHHVQLEESHELVRELANAFQRISVLSGPALFGANAYWFGFPRPDKSGFTSALADLTSEMGVGRLKPTEPASAKADKDGGIDLVLWKSFPDRRSGTTVMYVQVASGKKWRTKSVKSLLDGYFHHWYMDNPAHHYLEAITVPFMLHENCAPTKKHSFDDVAEDEAIRLEKSLGTVLDRARIVHLSHLSAVSCSEPGLREDYNRVRTWTQSVLGVIRA